MGFHNPVFKVVAASVRKDLIPFYQYAARKQGIEFDDLVLQQFSEELRTKLRLAREKGREGWQTDECSQETLSNMLREHVEKGDPRDVAIFAMFLWARGETIKKC